jgi:HlyD family secretion protein
VISSPTSNVGEGTVLLKMADLNLVQVGALVDETDIGKIQPGLATTITVDAYPNRPFPGHVLKIEPLATVQQNVTMFPVLIRIENRDNLLKPGMNAEVEIHVGQRDSVLAVPASALRTAKDVSSAADVLGLSMDAVQQQLAQSTPGAPDDSGKAPVRAVAATGATMTMPDGRVVPLPEGVSEQQVRALFQKRMGGGELTENERALLRKVFQGMRGSGGRGGDGMGGRSQSTQDSRLGGRYIVFVRRNGEIRAANVVTGLNDLDYSEVISGLTEQDSVLVLPSASLVQAQKDFTQRVQRMTGGGGLPGMQSGSKAPR